MTGGATSKWPWSELGIAETTDKDAIRAAFLARKSELDSSMQISAFAKLTEAREKALFLASEMQRAAERGQSGPSSTPDVVAPPQVTDLERPHSLPDIDAPVGRELDSETLRGEPIDTNALETDFPEPEPGQGFYVDPSYSVAQSTSPEQSRYEPEIDWTNLQRSTFFRRYRLDQFGIWWLMGIFLLLAFCSKDEKVELETQTGEVLPPVRTVTVSPDELPFDQDQELLGVIVEDLFGDGSRFAEIERDDREFAQTLAFQVGFDGYDAREARTHIRAEILRVRPVVSHADLILASEVYLGWLEKARSIGSAECRNVYSRAFDNGGPIMGDAAMLKERELARRFVRMRNFSRRTEGGTSIMLPEWVIENVERQSGIGRETLGEALSDPEHPLRCDATIALLEVILAQPDDDAIDALAAL